MSRHEALIAVKKEITVQLTEAEIRGILQFCQWHFPRKEPDLECTTTWLLRVALMHPTITSRLLGGIVRYVQAEGIDQRQHAIGCIAAHKAYRKVKAVIV